MRSGVAPGQGRLGLASHRAADPNTALLCLGRIAAEGVIGATAVGSALVPVSASPHLACKGCRAQVSGASLSKLLSLAQHSDGLKAASPRCSGGSDRMMSASAPEVRQGQQWSMLGLAVLWPSADAGCCVSGEGSACVGCSSAADLAAAVLTLCCTSAVWGIGFVQARRDFPNVAQGPRGKVEH